MLFMCIPLMISDTEHLSMYLLAICISSRKKCLSQPFAHVLTDPKLADGGIQSALRVH